MSYSEERPIEKVYYTIGEVAEIIGEKSSLVRFWSDKFSDIIKPVRNKKGNRLFTPKDLENIRLIHHLVKESGLTLEGVRRRLSKNATGEEKRLEIIQKLKSIREKLMEISNELKEGEVASKEGESDAFIDRIIEN